jgi:BCD family chlorophyll transporter-like MFS transporter
MVQHLWKKIPFFTNESSSIFNLPLLQSQTKIIRDPISSLKGRFSMNFKKFQLGLVHVAVAMTLVPINSTLNRVMIRELSLSATLVAILASLPYFFSPMQVAIGSFSDRHPVFGLRRTPYIYAGLVLCSLGVAISPWAAFKLAEGGAIGVLAGITPFLAWGMGYNLSSVCYLALASELSGEKERGSTIAVMWFMMILGIILTAVGLGMMVESYSPAVLQNAFVVVGAVALVMGSIGLVWLEPRSSGNVIPSETTSYRKMIDAVLSNPVGRTFFVYLLLLLAAILGQDVLLEPFAAEAFNWSVSQTTRLTSIWGGAVLLTILLASPLEKILSRKMVAQIGNLGALGGFLLILVSGGLRSSAGFYGGVLLLGAGTGLSTVANLALMFDLTLPGQVGLFVGAWGLSNSLSRLVGSILGGVVRDVATNLSGVPLTGYVVVFGIESLMLLAAILMLGRIDVGLFRASSAIPTPLERAAISE